MRLKFSATDDCQKQLFFVTGSGSTSWCFTRIEPSGVQQVSFQSLSSQISSTWSSGAMSMTAGFMLKFVDPQIFENMFLVGLCRRLLTRIFSSHNLDLPAQPLSVRVKPSRKLLGFSISG